MSESNLPVVSFPDPLERPQLRRAIYGILITIAVGNMVGRIFAVNAVDMIRLEQNLIDREVRPRLDKQIASLRAAGASFDRAALEKEIRAQLRDDPRIRKQRPFLSANDRSRWTTIRALVEHGTYAIDDIVAEPNWDTIDMVKHQDAEGRWRLYSSKPPLLATLYAAPYWVVYQIAGAVGSTEVEGEEPAPITLGTHPYEIGRGLLILYNVVPMVIYFLLLGRLLDRFGATDWGRIFVMAAATLGTFLTTFAVTLNNHLPAAVSALVTVWAAARIWYDGEQCPCYYILAGFFAAFTAACELPALSFFGLVGAALLWKNPKPTLLFGVPAAVVVLLAYFGTNYLAHESFRPPYTHRGDGDLLFTHNPGPRFGAEEQGQLNRGEAPDALRDAFVEHERPLSENLLVRKKTGKLNPEEANRWVIEDRGNDVWYILRADRAPPVESYDGLFVHEHDDWYDYEYTRVIDGRVIQSYWRDPKGIDGGEPDLGKYSLHLLVGHHGIFSLTPIWLLIIPGIVMLCSVERGYGYRALAALIAIVTIVCVVFYILRPPLDRNYGGMTSGFRWVYWLAPLWLLAALPAADWLSARRWARGLGYVLLALSVISVVYPTWNPWTYPWLTNFWLYTGWEEF